MGIAGINIEDSVVMNERIILEATEFAKTLREVKMLLLEESLETFVNVRTDTFLLGHTEALKETKTRIQLYENSGADGIFIPCVVKETDIKEVMNATKLPNFDYLHALGVKRISMGNFLIENMYSQFEQRVKNVLNEKTFNSIF